MAEINVISESVQAFGAVSGPAAGAPIVQIPASSLPEGTYRITVYARYGADPGIENNMELRAGDTRLLQLDVAAVRRDWAPRITVCVHLDGTQSLSVNAIAAAGAAHDYKATLMACRIWHKV